MLDKKNLSKVEKSKKTQDEKIADKQDFISELSDPIIRFCLDGITYRREDWWTLRHAFQGVQIFGGIGSGKSSGSGRMLALSYLKKGFGGIVLTGKIDEVDYWKEYAELTGRKDDLIIFEKGGPYRFNALQYENQRSIDKGETFNLVNLLMDINELGRNYTSGGSGGGGNEVFWDNAVRRCISRIVDLLKLTNKEISIANLRKVLISAPTKEHMSKYKAFQAALRNRNNSVDERYQTREKLKNWASQYLCISLILEAMELKNNDQVEDLESYEFVRDYFFLEFANVPEKTRAIVVESILGTLEPFMSGILKNYFSNELSKGLMPEETYKKGKIIVINFPVKEYLIAGVFAQAIYKKIWQQAIERRNAKVFKRPVFLWVDEAQNFLNKDDMNFQTTARSSRASTVLITQNISNYYSTIGGSHPKEQTNSLLGNLGTKMFHANNDHVTNQWAADTISKVMQMQTGSNTNLDKMESTTSTSESFSYQVMPHDFTILRTGGEENNCEVNAFITVAGKKWSTGKNYAQITFDQNIKPS